MMHFQERKQTNKQINKTKKRMQYEWKKTEGIHLEK